MMSLGATYDKNPLTTEFQKFGQKSRFFKKFSKIRKSMIFFENRQTLGEATEARFGRMELLWIPYERILSIFSSFKAQKLLRGICTHQAHQIDGDKNLFSPISEYSKLLRKFCINTFLISLQLFVSKTS